MILLKTSDGRNVAVVDTVVMDVMAYNGKPPEVVSWGQRFFAIDRDDSDSSVTVYKEVLCYFVTNYDKVTLA